MIDKSSTIDLMENHQQTPSNDSELLILYKDILFPLSSHPYGRRSLTKPLSAEATKLSRMCGDTATVRISIEQDKIADVQIAGEACSFCSASSSLMYLDILNKTVLEAKSTIDKIKETLDMEHDMVPFEGDLQAINSVRRFPHRIKCALLPWESLETAIGTWESSK